MVSAISIGQSQDEQEISRLKKHWTELLDKGDTTSLKEIWTKEYVVNNPNGRIVTTKEIVALMKSGHVFLKVERITFNQNNGFFGFYVNE